MQPQELRIENYYQSVKWKKPVRLDITDYYELWYLCDSADLDNEIISKMFEPIPLTEEWLVKCGFKIIDVKHRDRPVSKKIYKKYPIVLKSNLLSEKSDIWNVSMGTLGEIDSWKFIIYIDYVHQLQNLYFILTGEELPINI